MTLKSELFIRLLVAVTIVGVIYKLFAPLLNHFLTNLLTGKTKEDNDIDKMIRRQESLLRAGDKVTTTYPQDGARAGTSKKQESKTIAEYIRAFEHEKNSEKKNEMTTMLELFDNLRWGEGKVTNQLKTKLDAFFKRSVEMTLLNKVLRTLFQNDVLIKIKGKELPTERDLVEILKTWILIEFIFQGTSNMHKTFQVTPINLVQGIKYLLFHDKKKSDQHLFNLLMKNHKEIKEEDIRAKIMAMTISEEPLSKYDLLIKKLEELANVFAILTPLPPLADKNDLEGAKKIFGIEKTLQQDEIKKTYKKMALKKHPDRLSGYDIPEELMKRAGDNFTKLKEAYDILTKGSE